MEKITVVVPYSPEEFWGPSLLQWSNSPLVAEIIVLHRGEYSGSHPKIRSLECDSPSSGRTLTILHGEISTPFFMLIPSPVKIIPGEDSLERLSVSMETTGAGIVYGDYDEVKKEETAHHPLIDYQSGSVRDEFNFGGLLFFSTSAVRGAIARHGPLLDTREAGLYDLRLRVAIDSRIVHIPESLYTMDTSVSGVPGRTMFDYVDSQNRDVQIEMERVFTWYLRRIGAFIDPATLTDVVDSGPFPVEASVVIPVRNREKTIADALRSALSQRLAVPWNIIVVDNHSTDTTSAIIHDIAGKDRRVVRHIPQRRDLGIGGCWNEAVSHPLCGRYSVQLDSDDLYSDDNSLSRILDLFRQEKLAMVIGSYRLVNYQLHEIPPGIIDHREWTAENGHNNALRVNGLGAPRAFSTRVIREVQFPNVSYGEDYAAGLAVSRKFRIGRIFEPLYLCRRWEGNSDEGLGIDNINRNDYYKDTIRSREIITRQKQYPVLE